MIGQHRIGEGEHAFGVQVVLAIALGSAGLGKSIVDLIAAAAAGPLQHAVDNPPSPFVLVEAERLKIVQRA